MPGKRFFRLDRPFDDAVQSRKLSAVIDVLLRAQLSGAQARRTAEKILSDYDALPQAGFSMQGINLLSMSDKFWQSG